MHSAAASTRYMLADMSSPLEPPSAPFAARQDSSRSFGSGSSPLLKDERPLSTSLSVNYLPSKFSNTLVTKRRRNGKGGAGGLMMPKQGGGREAFKSNEARMPGAGDDDYDGVDVFGNKEGGRTRHSGRWNRFKWCLFVANTLVSMLSLPLSSSLCRLLCHRASNLKRTWRCTPADLSRAFLLDNV